MPTGAGAVSAFTRARSWGIACPTCAHPRAAPRSAKRWPPSRPASRSITSIFPTLFRGQEVYLCWKLGEPFIEFWHGMNEGFRGRKAIDRDFSDHLEGG